MCINCFSPPKDHCNLIDYMLRGFVLFASSNLNPSMMQSQDTTSKAVDLGVGMVQLI